MARILAVDWNRHEARYVLAAARRGKLEIHAAASVVLPQVTEAAGQSHPDLGGSLRNALAGQKLGGAVTLVAVERAGVELLQFTLPPARDDELPELVANQVLRESPTASEESVVDFVPMNENPAEPREVTAAVLSQPQLERIRGACAAAGLKPKRLVLRSHAAASLFLRTGADREEVCLLVNPVADEVDLTVIVEGKAVFSRTARLPDTADQDKVSERLLAEIKRTLAVGLQGEWGTDPVECVYVFGRPHEHPVLLQRIRDELLLPAKSCDPLETVVMVGAVVPENPGRYAALLGMLLDEAHGGKHAIDFLHPRRQRRPVDRRRIIPVAAAVAAVVMLVGGYFAWDAFATVNAKNRELSAGLRRTRSTLQRMQKQQQLAAAIRQWQAGDVNWLEELRELSERFPAAQDAVVLRMSLTPSRQGGGVIEVQGLVREPSAVFRMEHDLRDPHHTVSSRRVQDSAQDKDYTRHFDTRIGVAKRNKSQYAQDRQPGKSR
jgi:hypothetical protein